MNNQEQEKILDEDMEREMHYILGDIIEEEYLGISNEAPCFFYFNSGLNSLNRPVIHKYKISVSFLRSKNAFYKHIKDRASIIVYTINKRSFVGKDLSILFYEINNEYISDGRIFSEQYSKYTYVFHVDQRHKIEEDIETVTYNYMLSLKNEPEFKFYVSYTYNKKQLIPAIDYSKDTYFIYMRNFDINVNKDIFFGRVQPDFVINQENIFSIKHFRSENLSYNDIFQITSGGLHPEQIRDSLLNEKLLADLNFADLKNINNPFVVINDQQFVAREIYIIRTEFSFCNYKNESIYSYIINNKRDFSFSMVKKNIKIGEKILDDRVERRALALFSFTDIMAGKQAQIAALILSDGTFINLGINKIKEKLLMNKISRIKNDYVNHLKGINENSFYTKKILMDSMNLTEGKKKKNHIKNLIDKI